MVYYMFDSKGMPDIKNGILATLDGHEVPT